MRSILYQIAAILGDINAVRRGRVVERLHNRFLGRLLRRFMPWK